MSILIDPVYGNKLSKEIERKKAEAKLENKKKPVKIKKRVGRPKKPIEETVKYKKKKDLEARKQKSIDEEGYVWLVKFKDIKNGEHAIKKCITCCSEFKYKKKDTRGRKKLSKKKLEEIRNNRTEEEKLAIKKKMEKLTNLRLEKKKKIQLII